MLEDISQQLRGEIGEHGRSGKCRHRSCSHVHRERAFMLCGTRYRVVDTFREDGSKAGVCCSSRLYGAYLRPTPLYIYHMGRIHRTSGNTKHGTHRIFGGSSSLGAGPYQSNLHPGWWRATRKRHQGTYETERGAKACLKRASTTEKRVRRLRMLGGGA